MIGPAYLVCATQRSGSTLLCEALTATGVAGCPEEYFEARPSTGARRAPRDYLEGLGDLNALALVPDDDEQGASPHSSLVGVRDYGEHLARVRDWGTGPNGVWGAKVMWDHLGDLRELSGGRGPEELFPGLRYVWVRRADTVRQAISLWRAMQTRTWRRAGAQISHCSSAAGEPAYCFPALRHLAERLARHDAAWEGFLAARDRPVLALRYEEIAGDVAGAVRAVCDHLEVALSEDVAPEAPLTRQADELSAAWVERYESDARAVAPA